MWNFEFLGARFNIIHNILVLVFLQKKIISRKQYGQNTKYKKFCFFSAFCTMVEKLSKKTIYFSFYRI